MNEKTRFLAASRKNQSGRQTQSAAADSRRSDIDILRAVAVLAVLLFHFQVPGFQGGFVGVDIFFVISGFLISSHILSSAEKGEFSYLGFFARRAQRLVPALLFVVLLVWIASVFFATPSVYRQTLRELLYTVTYLSNFLFWVESGYFDASALSKPLLHTWSLSVEEQFYLLWPAILISLFSRNRLLPGLAIMFLLSLLACELLLRVDPSAAFYLFPFRIFEFAIGAFFSRLKWSPSERLENAVVISSIVTIAATIAFLQESWAFPGISVVPLCLATGLIIHCQSRRLNAENAGTRLFTWIGRISYSAYLVHWPIVVFYVLENGEVISLPVAVLMLVSSLLVADLMWRIIEQPFQRRRARGYIFAIPFSVVLVTSVLFVAMPVYERVRVERKSIDQLLLELEPRKQFINRLYKEYKGVEGGPLRLSVVGDSHAVDFAMAIKLAGLDAFTVTLIHEFCDPLTTALDAAELESLYDNLNNPRMTPEKCNEVHAGGLLDRIIQSNPDVIVVSERWRRPAIPFLLQSTHNLKKSFDIPVVLLGSNQEFIGTPDQLLRTVTDPEAVNGIAWQSRRDKTLINDSVREVAEQLGVHYIDKGQVVCPETGSCDYLYGGALTYIDHSHWTVPGMREFGRRFNDELSRLLSTRPDSADGSQVNP